MVRFYYPYECHADYFDCERIEARKLAIEACGISFFLQAEDGIRDKLVTVVQTCALPISGHTPEHRRILVVHLAAKQSCAPWALLRRRNLWPGREGQGVVQSEPGEELRGKGFEWAAEIGRATCRERVGITVDAVR